MAKAPCISLSLLILSGLLLNGNGQEQNTRYRHPQHDFSFVSTPDWDQEFGDFNGKQFRVTHPNKNMIVSLSFVPGCRNPEAYLRRIQGLEGLLCTTRQFDTLLNDYAAVVIKGNCLEGREAFTRMVVGFPSEKGLYLMEISCPEDCHAAHRQNVREILSSVRIGA
jgi:hypothetical protein